MKYHRLAIATLLLLVPSLGVALQFTKDKSVGDLVVKIVDGDTFKLANNQTIRLASIDAPETGRCYSREATEALSDLILNKRVILSDPYSDKYGRIMALVISQGQVINEVLVRNGFAVYTYDKTAAKAALQDANTYARSHNLGIYSDQCSQVVPPDLGCVIKGNLDQRENRLLYSFPSCGNYDLTVVETFSGDQWFCSEQDAIKAGYVRSGNCPDHQ
ncbi:MAG: thermonuclease family protein [Microgenomates group bacterium]